MQTGRNHSRVTFSRMSRGSAELASEPANRDRILAQPWILPIVIISGLASAYAIPWNYTNVSTVEILTTLVPLIAQFSLACLTSIFAFLGKSSWLGFLIAAQSLSILNALLYGINFWGVSLPTLPKVLLTLTALALVPTLIWGRKPIRYSPPGNSTFENAHDSDW